MGNIPNLLELVQFFDFMRGNPAAFVVLVTASVIFVVRDWRWALLALALQYLVAGLLYADVLAVRLVFAKVIVGLFICVILYFSARQVNWGELPRDVTPEEAVQLQQERLIRFGPYMLPTDTPFRVFLALMVVLVVWTLAQRPDYQLPAVPDHFNLAIYALGGLGLVTLSLTTEPLKVGMGLLTFLLGFDLLFSTLEQSAGMLALLAAAYLSVALVISYLIQTRHAFQALLDQVAPEE
jgi:hypothetical protein